MSSFWRDTIPRGTGAAGRLSVAPPGRNSRPWRVGKHVGRFPALETEGSDPGPRRAAGLPITLGKRWSRAINRSESALSYLRVNRTVDEIRVISNEVTGNSAPQKWQCGFGRGFLQHITTNSPLHLTRQLRARRDLKDGHVSTWNNA